MFTGIVEEKGQIMNIHANSEYAVQLTIRASMIVDDIQIGDSISVNGICLTVTNYNQSNFYVDVMPETIKATSLVSLQVGSYVNLERALLPTDRMGGHFVTGHVDGTGEIIRKESVENAMYYKIAISNSLLPYFIHKGSVAVDGVSLTVFNVEAEESVITISLIPHTMSATVFGEKEIGDIVNIECDLLAKHVHQYLKSEIRM